MKLALGTAQFGLNYGIANTAGRIDLTEAARIVSLADRQGIDTLDTAIAYGDSEDALGKIGVTGWKLISKLPALPEPCIDVTGWVHAQVEASLSRLGVGQLYAVLLHRPAQLFEHHGAALFSGMQDLVSRGMVQKIGVSIYDPSELNQLLTHWSFGLVQAPMSVFDRRLVESGWARRLHEKSVELHTRSAFLQGLLLMPPGSRPAWFRRWESLWASWDNWLYENSLSPLEACLRFALSVPEVDRVIVGVDSATHLQEILVSASGHVPDYSSAPYTDDPILLNPAHWNLQ